MNCELCGKKISKPKRVKVEGSTLQVCNQCAKYGKEVFQENQKDTEAVMDRVEKQKKKRSRNGFGDENKALAMDYPEIIRKARLEKDWTQEDLGKKINEKRSVIAKLEKADMRPSDNLRKKLENILEIDLLEEIESVSTSSHHEEKGLTIGDLIKEE